MTSAGNRYPGVAGANACRHPIRASAAGSTKLTVPFKQPFDLLKLETRLAPAVVEFAVGMLTAR
jgi:hypothetical protein